jgi:hypothetical protein
MNAVRVEDDTMPEALGEYSLQHHMHRPPYGKRDEIFMVVPTGQTGALIPERHTWSFNVLGEITVKPSIVYFNYHGFLINDVWS